MGIVLNYSQANGLVNTINEEGSGYTNNFLSLASCTSEILMLNLEEIHQEI